MASSSFILMTNKEDAINKYVKQLYCSSRIQVFLAAQGASELERAFRDVSEEEMLDNLKSIEESLR